MYHINLKRFANYIKEDYNDYKNLTLFDRMCIIFLIRKREILERIVKEDEGLMDIKKAIEDINTNENVWENYTKEELNLIIEVDKATQKGMKQGIQGTAQKMLDDNFDISIISKYTGLSIEDIKSLK